MQLNDVPTVVLVASGKGGVGKTTVASDFARKAKELNGSVGLIDADISTPNSPEVVGGEGQDLSDQRLSTHDALVPPEVNGIQLVSQGVVLPDDVPVLRDGEWRAEAVADYIQNVEWADDTELVVIDSPPGTGGELQVVASVVQPGYGVVVTTPHPSSVRDATKTHEFFKQAGIDHGAVLNMAYMPGKDIAHHVDSACDLTEIQGIGDAKRDEIGDLMYDQTPDKPLFGYDPDGLPDFPVGFDATIPYTPEWEARAAELDAIVRNQLATEEVDV